MRTPVLFFADSYHLILWSHQLFKLFCIVNTKCHQNESLSISYKKYFFPCSDCRISIILMPNAMPNHLLASVTPSGTNLQAFPGSKTSIEVVLTSHSDLIIPWYEVWWFSDMKVLIWRWTSTRRAWSTDLSLPESRYQISLHLSHIERYEGSDLMTHLLLEEPKALIWVCQNPDIRSLTHRTQDHRIIVRHTVEITLEPKCPDYIFHKLACG